MDSMYRTQADKDSMIKCPIATENKCRRKLKPVLFGNKKTLSYGCNKCRDGKPKEFYNIAIGLMSRGEFMRRKKEDNGT